jgi:hypothetical protein
VDKECRWCKKIVDEELSFASPIVGGEETVWICDCGEIVEDLQGISFNASKS